MVRIAICDDEPAFSESLSRRVAQEMERRGQACQIQCHAGAFGLLESPVPYDIVFLDVQMPGLDGMGLARKLREEGNLCALIFVSALKERVFDAFAVDAVDYLVKPVDGPRLEQALSRALLRMEARREDCLFIQTIHGCRHVKVGSIHYCEVINRKLYLHTADGVVDYYGKIEEAAGQLDHRFVRCHRSYLVNLDYLQEYANGQILLENGERIPVSRLRHQEVMEAMMRYMKGANL